MALHDLDCADQDPVARPTGLCAVGSTPARHKALPRTLVKGGPDLPPVSDMRDELDTVGKAGTSDVRVADRDHERSPTNQTRASDFGVAATLRGRRIFGPN